MIYGNVVGTTNGNMGKSFMVTDENGNKAVAVMVEEETEFTATANDIREGVIAATDSGVTKGTKVIPMYNTAQGWRIIPSGYTFSIPLAEMDMYDFTELQALMCRYNTSIANSVNTEKVSISGSVYNVASTDVLATVKKQSDNKTINFDITNDANVPFILRYFTYKEIY